MAVKRVVLSLIFCLSTVSLYAAFRDGDNTIAGFRLNSGDLPLRSTGLIISETGEYLQELDSLPVLKPGQVIMRRKDGSGYRFYKGILDTAAFYRKPQFYSAFTFPGWARLSDLILYRFYRAPTEMTGNDENEIYFDNERIYLRQFSRVYYYKNHNWYSIQGIPSLQLGAIELVSAPEGAQVTIDGEQTGLVTPCTIDRLIPGTYNVELFLAHHHFLRKSIRVYPQSKLYASFELLGDMDTVYITGKAPHGVLMLPQPPIDSQFVIDEKKIGDSRIRLEPGDHHVQWNGGFSYQSVDTVLFISEGAIFFFDHQFKRRYGVLRVIPYPVDAEVCIQGKPCRIGEQVLEIPSGRYSISAFRQGFINIIKSTTVEPDSITTCVMDLVQMPDRDGDGFTDNVDKCPDTYGLHDGCPRQRFGDAVEAKVQDLREFVRNDNFSAGFSLMGMIMKIPTRKKFSNFLSTFSSGKIGGINNYRGLTFLNMFEASYRGLFASVELGQWSAGLHYQREDTLELAAGNSRYLVFYDSLDVEPAIFIPSTGVSLGVHYNWSWINVVYSVGYQWEDIILDQVFNTSTGEFQRITFNNDWWFHQLYTEADLHVGEAFMPSLYFKFKFPFGPFKRTRWHVMQAGIQIKLTPALMGKGKRNGLNKVGDKENE